MTETSDPAQGQCAVVIYDTTGEPWQCGEDPTAIVMPKGSEAKFRFCEAHALQLTLAVFRRR